MPAVNQIEVHPFFGNEAARAADAQHGIATEAWAPIARGKVNDDPTIKEIADRVGRTPAQVALRWHIQRGDIVFPKSTRAERMRENFAIFDFAALRRRRRGDQRARPRRGRPDRPEPEHHGLAGLTLQRLTPPAEQARELGPLGRGQPLDQALLVGDVPAHQPVDQRQALPGEPDLP